MDVAGLLLELYGRIPPLAHEAVQGLGADELAARPTAQANTIGWLVWHLTRVQDDHVAELLDAEQLWLAGPWAAQLGLDPDPGNTGYGHSAREVDTIRPAGPDVLLDYLSAVDERTRAILRDLTPDDLDTVVDRRWDPPVTLGVRLVSVADDCLQHAGQAAYLRGLLDGETPPGAVSGRDRRSVAPPPGALRWAAASTCRLPVRPAGRPVRPPPSRPVRARRRRLRFESVAGARQPIRRPSPSVQTPVTRLTVYRIATSVGREVVLRRPPVALPDTPLGSAEGRPLAGRTRGPPSSSSRC
jgi:hypothetical protein